MKYKKLIAVKNEIKQFKENGLTDKQIVKILNKDFGIKITIQGVNLFCHRHFGTTSSINKKLDTIKHEILKYKNALITYKELADLIKKNYGIVITTRGLYVYCRKELGFERGKNKKLNTIKKELLKYKDSNITYPKLAEIIERDFDIKISYVMLNIYCKSELDFADRKSGIKSELHTIKDQLLKYKNSKVTYPKLAQIIKKDFGIGISAVNLRLFCVNKLDFPSRKQVMPL